MERRNLNAGARVAKQEEDSGNQRARMQRSPGNIAFGIAAYMQALQAHQHPRADRRGAGKNRPRFNVAVDMPRD